jgi:hypothetical protein
MRYSYGPGYGYNQIDGTKVLYQIIILILIVLQWTLNSSSDPDNLTSNGGLFIITLFILISCMCRGGYQNYPVCNCRRKHRYFW